MKVQFSFIIQVLGQVYFNTHSILIIAQNRITLDLLRTTTQKTDLRVFSETNIQR